MSGYKNGPGCSGLEVAIIGMACRFPGANNVAAFWRNLRDGVRSVSSFTDEELIAARVPEDVFRNPAYVRSNAILDGVDLFDAGYFDYSPREARMMDPQHRIFLECCSQALADAGYDAPNSGSLIGVYAGANINTYFFNFYSSDMTESSGDVQPLIANDKDYLATRVSYKLNLRGPSITVQTACSTSLVAVHLACRGLLSGECDIALAGGVSVRVPQKAGYLYQEGGIHSPDGYCRAFDAKAQGTTFGSGAGMVVLKRLDQAVKDGDFIYAIIKGSAVNNDGGVKVGYTAPSLEGQAAVIRAAYQMAEVAPESIGYIEAHATGTPLGDPIEVEALTEVFSASTNSKQFCGLGSVKTNFGHLVTAAGIAGLIKTVLALMHRQIPPSLNFQQPNPHIHFENSPFYVNQALRDWPLAHGIRRAGVSSFGVGGTNAHVVLEEAPLRRPIAPPVRPWQVLLLSARTESALKTAARELGSDLGNHPAEALPDIAFTLQVGRREFSHRLAVVCGSLEDAQKALKNKDAEQGMKAALDGKRKSVAFMFPGQGTQYVGMAQEVYEIEPVFRAEFDRCCRILHSRFGLDLRSAIYPAELNIRLSAAERLNQTDLTQPALFAVEYALAKLWMSWGLVPDALIGHSIGEYVAATISGVFAFEDALALVAIRGRLIQALPQGSMLAVSLSESKVRTLLSGQLALAAVNTPSSCVVAGLSSEVVALEERLKRENIPHLRIRTSHAFHSPMMEPALAPFSEQLQHIRLRPPQIPFPSNLTGGWISADEATSPNYWVRHLRNTVLFSRGLQTLAQEPDRLLLEVGVGRTLKNFAEKHPGRPPGQLALSSLPGESDERNAEMVLLSAVSQLWIAGAGVDWKAFASVDKRRRLPIPTYPFERTSYWIESSKPAIRERGQTKPEANAAPFLAIPSWKRSLPPLVSRAEDIDASKTWMVFTDGSTFGAEIISRLSRAGGHVLTVQSGEKFERAGDRSYKINPRQNSDYIVLFAELIAAGEMPRIIVHAWNATHDPTLFAQDAYRDQSLYLGFFSLLFIAQALEKQRYRENLDLVAVVANLHSIAGEALPFPENATLAATCKVVPLEYPNIRCRVIDIMPSARDDFGGRRAAAQVLNECMMDGPDRLVAYRNQDRWIQTFESIEIPKAEQRKSLLRAEGVYLIIGGTGGIGLLLAEYLAKKVRARLVLTGLTAFPPREEWDDWIKSHGEEDKLSRKLRRFKQIEDLDGSVKFAQADVADHAQMQAVLAEMKNSYGTVHGVFHLAGIAGGRPMQLTTQELARRVLSPKIQGTRVLEKVLQDVPLDFLMLFSSTLAIAGGIGQIDYCAANTFLDAFAHYSAASIGRLTLSINWDGWRGLGMNALPGSEGEGGVTIHHPLIDQCLTATSDHADFLTTFEADKHWVLSEHTIAEVPALPGAAFLEMARAAFSHVVPGPAVIMEDVLFLAPLTVNPHASKVVHTLFNRKGAQFEFSIVASEMTGHHGRGRKEYARGKIGRGAGNSSRTDISRVMARCPREILIASEEQRSDPGQLVRWGERWKNLRKINIGEDEALALQEIPDSFSADLSSLYLHPALLDVATAFLALVSGMEDYIPLSYRRIMVYGQLMPHIYTHSRRKNMGSVERTRVAFDVTLLDLQGNVLVEIEDFVMIQESALGMHGMQLRVQKGTTRPDELLANNDPAPPVPTEDEFSPETALAAFERILSMPPTPQIVVSAEDIHARIERVQSLTLDKFAQEAARAAVSTFGHSRPSMQTDYARPANELERKVADVWQEVLAIDQIGIDDNFFDLGGHSLLAIQIVERLRQAFGIEIALSTVIEAPTIRNIAEFIGNADREREREQREILERVARLSDEEAELELRKHVSRRP